MALFPTGNVKLAAASLGIGLVVLAIKYAAYHLTGSVALFSDALESIVNVTTALAALIAVRLSARPADASLPYGYHKAEYFSAVLVGMMIVVAALMIVREAYLGIVDPQPIETPLVGVAVNAAATMLNAAWAAVLLRAARRNRSPALAAEGRHLVTDVISSLGVIAGLLLVVVTGIGLLDPLLALLVAANILWSGWKLLSESVSGLMDTAVPADTMTAIRTVIAANADGAIEAHDIRTRRAASVTFVDFHLVVPGAMTVEDAHAICDRIEHELQAVVPDAQVTIHVEPENKAKHSGIVVL